MTRPPTRAAARSVGWARSKPLSISPLSISAFYGPKKRISSLRKVLKSGVVYEVRELGTIVRCLGCENALVRFAHHCGR